MMKRSECYHLAQIAVLTSPTISPERKLQVLEVLYGNKSHAEWLEEREAEEKKNEEQKENEA